MLGIEAKAKGCASKFLYLLLVGWKGLGACCLTVREKSDWEGGFLFFFFIVPFFFNCFLVCIVQCMVYRYMLCLSCLFGSYCLIRALSLVMFTFSSTGSVFFFFFFGG